MNAAQPLTGKAATGGRHDVPRASVIIPHLNTPALLDRCLHSVLAQRLDHGGFEVIVVDNGSDTPLDGLMEKWPTVRFLTEREPGPGPARNLGVAHARGQVLAFIDADIRAGEHWLQQGVDAVRRDPSHPYGGDVRIDFRDPRHPTGIEAYEAVFSFRQKMYIEKRGFSGAGNLVTDRRLWARVGPFAGIGTAEDRDWGLRAKALGAPARYLPAMVVYHPARGSMHEMTARLDRLAVQDFAAWRDGGRPLLLWHLRAWAVLLAAFLQVAMLLFSPRVPRFGARFRGAAVLFRTRMHRFSRMHAIPREEHPETAMRWNRTT